MSARLLVLLVLAAPVGAAVQAMDEPSLFAPLSTLAVGARTGDVVLADVDRDGHLDLITVHPGGTLTVRIGDGRGGFTSAGRGPLALPPGGGAIAVGDVTGDDVPDLVVASRDGEREYVDVLIGDGSGRFQVESRSRYTTATAFAYYKPVFHLVDLNADGHTDIVSANGRRNTIEILLGDGRGGFTIAEDVTLEADGDFFTSAVADMDGDGRVDIVWTSSRGRDAGRVFVRRGDGSGRFTASRAVATVPSGPRVAALGDVNGDARADIVVTHAETNLLSVLVNTGAGEFEPVPGSPHELTHEAFEVRLADVNRDGRTDLVAATVNSRMPPHESGVVVMVGGDRGLAPAPGSPLPVRPGAYHLAVGDLDEDGRTDLIASSFESDSIGVLMGR